MAGEDFYAGEDLEAILAAIDEDVWDKDDEFNAEINSLLVNIEEEPSQSGFKCDMCEKVCKSKQGFSRHQNAKHRENQPEEVSITSKDLSAEDRLHPLYFNKYINECAKQLASDGCYSDETINTFGSYYCSLDDANFTYQFVRDVIQSFNGNGEKFYPRFYDCVSGEDNIFKNLNRKCSVILGFELANVVLAHLNGTILSSENASSSTCQFNKKECNIVKYISGYVMQTLYSRLRKSTKHRSDTNIKQMSILLAGKDSSESSTEEDELIDAKNRGGLWKVTNGVSEIFFAVEKYFRANVANQKRKIDVKCMVLRLMKYSSILSHYTTLTNLASEELDKEISLNLLESMITLYLHARTFKYVYLQKEAFKIESAKKKMKSLRTSTKQATKKLELGH